MQTLCDLRSEQRLHGLLDRYTSVHISMPSRVRAHRDRSHVGSKVPFGWLAFGTCIDITTRLTTHPNRASKDSQQQGGLAISTCGCDGLAVDRSS